MRFFLLIVLCLVTFTLSIPNPLAGSGKVVVRDPAIWYNSDSKSYFVFSTSNGIPIFTSTSLKGPWMESGSVLPNCSKLQRKGRCGPWAPDINHVNGQYVLYYAVSIGGSPNSSIGVATSPSMNNGPWNDLGEVFHSEKGDSYNAIDANLVTTHGLGLTFGSYHQGIFQIDLKDLRTPAQPGANDEPTEGGFTYKPRNSQYHFQFFSNGRTPLVGNSTRPPPGKEYKVLVGCSENPLGPFVGRDGQNLTQARDPPTGSLVLGLHDNMYAPGGQSVFLDPVSGRDVMVYHYVPNNALGGPSYLGINYLDFSSGWPVLVEE